MCPLLLQKNSLSMNGDNLRLWRLSHQKHFALWFLDEVFCSHFETASFGCLNSFLIAAACFITDSRDSKISKAFYKDRFAPSLNNLCCMRSWFIPHTKWSLNIESKEWPYSQYWLSLLSSAIYCDTLSPVFLLHMLNWSLSAIGFLFVFSWFAIKITNLLKVFSTGFTGPVCPLNNQYISIRQDV